MNRPPRAPKRPIITGPLFIRIVIVGTLLCAASFSFLDWAVDSGKSEAAARTIAVNIFVTGELFYLFNCRSLRYSMFKVGLFSNPFVLVGVVLMVLLQLGYTYLPFMNTAFRSAPISLVDWGYCVAVGVVIYIVMELNKIIQNRFLQNIAFFRD